MPDHEGAPSWEELYRSTAAERDRLAEQVAANRARYEDARRQRDEARAEVERLTADNERLSAKLDAACEMGRDHITRSQERRKDLITANITIERLSGALRHYALMDWAPDSDERGEIAREALGLADPHDEIDP